MARTVRNAKIDTPSARAKLPKRREPYWVVLTKGCAVGYRKGKNGGNWIARWRSIEGKQNYRALGAADDALSREESGGKTLPYVGAQEAAREWFTECGKEIGGTAKTGPYTVADVIADYLAEYEANGGKAVKDARTRADALIIPVLGAIEVADLTMTEIKDWHAGLAKSKARLRTRKGETQRFRETNGDPEAERRRKATANRTLAILKAALNHAWENDANGRIASDAAWRKVKPYKKVDAARGRYLKIAEAKQLINACGPELRALVQGALTTGARYGELAALNAEDYDPDTGQVYIRDSKSGDGRHVILNTEGMTLFEQLTAGRTGNTPIFRKASGERWQRSHQTRPFRDACKRAKISPPIGFHGMRHTYASHAIMNGAPPIVVAENLGHADTRMVEKHYGHLARKYVAKVIRKTAPRFGIKGDNVTALKR